MKVFIRHTDGDAGLTPAFQINHPDDVHSIIAGLSRAGRVFMSAIGDPCDGVIHQSVLGAACEPFCALLRGVQ